MNYKRLGALLVHYVRKRGLVHQKELYTEFLGKDVTALLDEFVRYMDNEQLDSYAANCLNAGYSSLRREGTFVAQKLADRIMCTLMSRALFFMNRWRPGSASAEETDPMNEPLKEHIRCAIVNIFMYILLESPCRSEMGIDNAWYTMKQMEQGSGGRLISQGKCAQGKFENIKIQEFDMETTINTWLQKNKNLTETIGGKGIQSTCTPSLAALGGATRVTHGANAPIAMQHEEKQAIEKLGKEMKTIVQEVKTAVVKCAQTPGTCMEPIQEVSSSDPEDAASEDTVSNSVKSDTPAPSTEPTAKTKSPEKGPNGTDDKHKDQAQPSSTPSPTASGAGSPGAPPSPPAGNTDVGRAHKTGEEDGAPAGSARGGQPSSTSQDPATSGTGPVGTHTDNTGKCTSRTEVHVAKNAGKGIQGASSTTTLSFVSSPEATNDCANKSKDSGPGDTVVVEGNDDPPPLNPPKPAPTNPDQSGTSGSGGGGEPAPGGGAGGGVSSGEGKDAGTDGGRGTSAGGHGGSGSDAGWDAPTPATPYVPPGLTWEDVKRYTPAIIPAVVGIGVIAFFLWKYFAFLGQKRRRTYRTVRNVPSPPLDEEILEHLQRGAPPPDYGYTMLTDRQPASTSDRRRRHPRVHRRTIIELHLEVLNECEAAAWETVKDDYWKIVVQECARDLQQDAKGHSSFPDTPSTNQDLSRNNVSSILNPSTDSDGTDPCPRNDEDPDPWSCMETIQLATDRSPPNDCDSWSCMETIQLQTDPCSPHDPDPWSCMETTELHTAPCAPHAHDPDAWSCMETIQLPTDPGASNEHDPDPWKCMETIQLPTGPCPPNDWDSCSCMETIQLPTDPCPPNEHDPAPWSCMETIQLETDPCAPNDCDPWSCMENIQLPTDASAPNEHDPWSCMETIQLDAQQNAHFNPGDATSHCTHRINWIERHKHILRACTGQPWFNALKLQWTQYLSEQMVANEDNGHRELGEYGNIPYMQSKKLVLWKQWVAQQHALMHIYGEEEWFQRLLNSVEEETVPEKREVPGVEKHLEVEKAMGTEHLLHVRDVPRSQLHKQPYMTKPLTAKTWILILALVIEHCEVECRLQEKELYVDELLHKL
ncbi:hypothetical protein AK88_04931 [Plasmodium fragile]|uniref:Schizont-infected cell agglutination C-terminal domain-containing protein n=1 Tax=Plasmodium fragile TaxID=5857 RepID=A0A0D9QEJ4_PLAFR|nr:uncharacterized protein AK88_04931 [Plasmodium fragile]KJP85428.1 hypothetical protein AK88_04931 [Plasmodium fragile]